MRPIGENATTVQLVWDNHFGAFAGMDRDKVMWDYDDNSIIMTYNDNCFLTNANATAEAQQKRRGYREFKGRAQIRGFFDSLFNQLGNNVTNVNCIGPERLGGTCTPAADANNGPVVQEAVPGIEHANVFLTWRTANTTLGMTRLIQYATDTFSFRNIGGEYFIDLQTIVSTEPATATDTADCPESDQRPVNPADSTEEIYAAWANHYAAFGSKNLTQMMFDYDDNSKIQVFDNREGQQRLYTYDTLTEIEGFFNVLFQQITAGADAQGEEGVAVGLLEVEPAFNSVFLVWQSNNHPKATDTFIFKGAKIAQQTIVIESNAAISPALPGTPSMVATKVFDRGNAVMV